MQQILKFKIEIFDVRMRSSINIIDDTNLVRNIQINKNTSLDNIATITFSKSKTYELIPMESVLKLYNYVKIELTLKNYYPDSTEKFYFSGFIQTINKASNFSATPSATVSITISDYANLLKTTFYTKNLTFLEILNQAVPEFRMINLTEYLGDSSKKLLDDFYSPPQLGFIFFAFLYFKFMYKIVYNEDGSSKKTAPPNSKEIFKKFKIYTPFGFDIPIQNGDSFLKGQDQTITIYKQLQGVALDLFKYIYPEPLFEFSTYETEDSVILMIRFTPLMKFDRAITPPKNITFGSQDDYMPGLYATRAISTQDFAFDPNSYNVIERFDFGHNRIKSIRETVGVSPSQLLKEHLDAEPKKLLSTLQDAIGESKKLSIEDLIADDTEADEITKNFFNVMPLDSDLMETLSMTRSANSVVNVIWTVPTTDTAIVKMSGREMVYAYLEQRLQEVGGADKFGNYVAQQFNPNFNPNPVFLMDYRGVFGSDFISGDMNYFGFREFEIKWNYLSLHYNTAAYILAYVDKSILEEAKAASKDTVVTRMLDDAIRTNSDATTQSSSAKNGNPRQAVTMFERAGATQGDFPSSGPLTKVTSFRQTSRAGNLPKRSKNQVPGLDVARNSRLFTDALQTYKDVIDEKGMKSATKIIQLLMKAKKDDAELMGGFVAKLNSVVAEAYRENEHLYDCAVTRPIVLSVLPGMIVQSTSKSAKGESPRIKGYVTGISHNIDFNAASMKSAISISRAASDDSGVVAETGI
jgi:hypothetical protein